MKTTQVLRRMALLAVAGGVWAGCEKAAVNEQTLPQRNVTANEAKVTQLLERALQEGTQEQYDAITADYKALTFDELELFNKVKTESDKERVVQKLAKEGVQLTQQQRQMLTNSLEEVNSLRSALNKQAVALYGVSYNKLADSVLYRLLDQESRNFGISPPNFNPEPTESNARPAQTMSCSEASFPYVSTKLTGNRKWNYWGEKRTPGTSDCDYEFRYSGYLFRFAPKDWFATKLCDSFGNAILRRSNNTYTRLLMGKWRVIFWEGDPGLTSVEMRDV